MGSGAVTHARKYIGVTLTRNGEKVPLMFAEPVTIHATKTPAWIRTDRRRAAAKRARVARRANRP